jgi:hypothetical protein
MLSNFYQYCLIVWCGISAVVEITALFSEGSPDRLMKVETQFGGFPKRLVRKYNIIHLDKECLWDGGSFETPL